MRVVDEPFRLQFTSVSALHSILSEFAQLGTHVCRLCNLTEHLFNLKQNHCHTHQAFLMFIATIFASYRQNLFKLEQQVTGDCSFGLSFFETLNELKLTCTPINNLMHLVDCSEIQYHNRWIFSEAIAVIEVFGTEVRHRSNL